MKTNHVRFVKPAQFIDGQMYVFMIQYKQENIAPEPWYLGWS